MIKRLRIAVVLLGACYASTGALAEVLPGSEWKPTEVNGVPFETQSEVFIRFEQDGRFLGNGGCNSMRGGFVTNQDAILLGPAATTMMACPDDINRQEFTFIRGLGVARFFERDGAALILKDGGGVTVMRLEQRDPD